LNDTTRFLKMKPYGIIAVFILAGCAFLLWFKPPATEEVGDISIQLAEAPLAEGFSRAEGDQVLEFPRDFGPHPAYQTEWWYYTGNLHTQDGRRFGYQLTFFRRGLLPPQDWAARQSAWGTNQIYMAHFALSDIKAENHHAFERFSRGAAGLAGAQADPYQVWLEDWQVIQTGSNRYRLTARSAGLRLDLELADLKGPILHGDQGYSQKGPESGNASYYFSQTRLDSSGSVQIEDEKYEVQGLSWMDHEFSTSALSAGQIGWDWFSIQLEDGSDLMVFQIRRADGSLDPSSSGTWVGPNGETRALGQADFEIQVEANWRSPHSGIRYPAQWRLLVPSLDLSLDIQPYMPDQEMEVSYTYWEGAVQVRARFGDQVLNGNGYIEMTGYGTSMETEF